MIRGDEAVGGFYEDLPVLLFVLLGVFVLVSASVFASGQLSERRELDWMEGIAEEVLTAILSHLTSADGVGYTATMAAMREMGLDSLAGMAARDACYCVNVVAIHPRTEWLCSAARGDPGSAVLTGLARALLNAVCDDGSTGIVEVTVLAW